MQMLKVLLLILAVSIPAALPAQEQTPEPDPEQKLRKLFAERAVLFDRAEHLFRQENAFFGGKSKNDLRAIVDQLQEVIEKDNEIIAEVERLKYSEEYVNFDLEQSLIQANRKAAELAHANENLRKRLRETQQRLADLRSGELPEEEGDSGSSVVGYLVVIGLLAAGFVVLLVLWWRNR